MTPIFLLPMIDAPQIADAPAARTSDLAVRAEQLFPQGLPTRSALQAVGVLVDDETGIDAVRMYERLAESVRTNVAALRHRLATTRVRSRKALVGALLAFAQVDGAPAPAMQTATEPAPTDVTKTPLDAVEPDAAVVAVADEGFSRGEIAEIWAAYKAQPTDLLRNKLVEQYLPIVRYNAERIWARLPEGVELDDLLSAGIFGLMDAIGSFDLSRGVKFETYCVPRIRGAMLDELRTMDWVPRLVRSKASKINEATKAFDVAHGRQPTVEELAMSMGLSVKEMEAMITEASAVGLISLDKKWYETDSYKDVREIDILDDKKAPNPAIGINKSDFLRKVTKGLNRNERMIIIGYYYEDMTMKEIGRTLDLSESRVSQMHSSIMARLQLNLEGRDREILAAIVAGI